MFTGIVQGIACVTRVRKKKDFSILTLSMAEDMLNNLVTGASIAVNGCCLTVTSINGLQVTFDVMQETLRVTNLNLLQEGDEVNVERAARFGDEIGGHQLSGHILSMAKVVERHESENNCTLWLSLPKVIAAYIFHKGYIAIDGVSLTIGEVKADRFCVGLIPETLNRTILGNRKINDYVNIEVDTQTQVIVDTVTRLMQEKQN